MKTNIILITLCSLLCSCETSTPSFTDLVNYKDHVINGCTLDAVNFQARLNKKEIKWSRILNIFFYDKGKPTGHTVCVFQDKDGVVWAWDIRGYVRITEDVNNPVKVAEQIPYISLVYRAYYE